MNNGELTTAQERKELMDLFHAAGESVDTAAAYVVTATRLAPRLAGDVERLQGALVKAVYDWRMLMEHISASQSAYALTLAKEHLRKAEDAVAQSRELT